MSSTKLLGWQRLLIIKLFPIVTALCLSGINENPVFCLQSDKQEGKTQKEIKEKQEIGKKIPWAGFINTGTDAL